MNYIMIIIGPEHPDLFTLELGNIDEFDFVHSSIYKYKPISTKLGQNEYDHKISDDFDCGCNQTSYLPLN